MHKYFVVLLASFIIISCNDTPVSGENEPKLKSETLPRSNGSHAEMLALVSDELFSAKTGEEVLRLFASEQDGLPQPEPIFKVMRAEPKKANSLLKRNKSILLIEI